MKQPAGSETIAQSEEEIHREPALIGPEGTGGPFGAVGIIDRNEGGLAAHGQPHIARLQIRVNDMPERYDFLPLLFRIGLRDPRRFEDPMDRHLVSELGLASFQSA